MKSENPARYRVANLHDLDDKINLDESVDEAVARALFTTHPFYWPLKIKVKGWIPKVIDPYDAMLEIDYVLECLAENLEEEFGDWENPSEILKNEDVEDAWRYFVGVLIRKFRSRQYERAHWLDVEIDVKKWATVNLDALIKSVREDVD